MCKAWEVNGRYRVASPEPAGDVTTLFQRLSGASLVGFDFPIGLPRRYAEKAAIRHFPTALQELGPEFYRPASKASEISLARPFYPATPGGTLKMHLVDGLGLTSSAELRRLCDQKTAKRPAACEVFWTLGANQVGRAAACGWRDLLKPALSLKQIQLWPFEGELSELLVNGVTVVAESYPAETYCHLDLRRAFGKRVNEGRRSQAARIFEWCESQDVLLDATLRSRIESGFGDRIDGEDQFDSFVGVLGVIEVMQDPEHFAAPTDPIIRDVEGWILGMQAPTAS